ncbi:MAG: DUF1501 domain-containing protein [Ilumatobacter sp.]|nr:DUF1501 domain-containing protein [Ilumatobacter sp.]
MLDPDISTADALRHLSRDEAPTATTLDRRRFLNLVGMGLGAGVVAGGSGSLLDHAFGHDPSAWAAGPLGGDDGVLVILGMFGGNDGLNSVVPYDDGNYVTMHGGLAIPGSQTLPLASGVGLNPNLPTFKRAWDDGHLAIVQGVGYGNPDLSHFNSMAYWMAGRPNAIPTTGWMGRWLDGYLAGGKDLYAAAEVGTSVPLHLIGAQRQGTVVSAGRPGYGSVTDARSERQYATIRSMAAGATAGWSGPVGQAFVDQLDLARTLSPVIPAEDALPDEAIVARLEVAARLINANLGFRVLTAGFGDFDSHAGQPSQHTERMGELDAAVRRFFEVLDPAWASRVTLMTFSEFGRTPWDNDGAGTDHGTSAPHFVFGANVRGGFYGQQPTLAGLRRWDRMAHHVDFRSYYASVIDGWMGGGSTEVLGGTFENLGLFAGAPGSTPPNGPVLGSGGPGPAPTPVPTPVPTASTYFHPIAPTRIFDTRLGGGAAVGAGQLVRVPVAGVAGIPATGVTAVVANVTAVNPSHPMHFTVYPGGQTKPETSNLNSVPGRTVPNLVVMAVGADGHIEVFNSHGATHCLVDVFGYVDARQSSGVRFVPTSPARLFDSRDGTGVRAGALQPGEHVDIPVAGRAGVPASGATAVVLNLTAVGPDRHGHLRMTPTGRTPAETSNVNFAPGDVVPNLVVCELGPDGALRLDSTAAATHVVGDVFGYFGTTGDRLVTTSPQRLLDTRLGLGAARRPAGPGHRVDLQVAGIGGVPAAATAVVLNVTATNVAAASHVSVWPRGGVDPSTSNLNLRAGDTIANLVICRIGDQQSVSLANPLADCDLIADVLGYFVP